MGIESTQGNTMGFFSKLTCDTQESVASIHSGHPNALKPIYMLQPHGIAPLKQDTYEGYGVVGINWFEWLSYANYGVANNMLGVFLDCGKYLEDENGVVYACKMHIDEASLRTVIGDETKIVLFQDYASPIDELNGLDMNTAMEKNIVRQCKPNVEYPVKLSYNPLAIYEENPASEDCPAQGFFYDDEL
jgi:hypothetical protein